MTTPDLSRDPLYAVLRDRVGEEHTMELLSRLPPPGDGPATQRDMARMDERFDRMDERFDRMDERFDRMDERFDRYDAKFDRYDDKLERFHIGLREQTRNIMLVNAVMMLTLATILVAVGLVP